LRGSRGERGQRAECWVDRAPPARLGAARGGDSWLAR
jgi:hypothetical protein